MAMSKFASGVSLITTVTEDGSVHAMTCNSLTSISLEPPLVLVCVSHARHTNGHIGRSGRYAVSVLGRDQEEAARYYALDESGRTGDAPVEFVFNESGMPMVKGCLSFLDCVLLATHEHGDHSIFVGKLREARVRGGEPLIYHERRYVGVDGGSVPPRPGVQLRCGD